MSSPSPLKDLQSLRQLRDELKLQAHLFKGDLAEEWKNLEREMKVVLHTQSAPIKEAARKSAKDVKAASTQLVRALKKSCQRIKQSLP
jgi:hypothetical protein